MYYVYNDPKTHFGLTMIKNKKDFNFFETILKVETEQYLREFDDHSVVEPFLVVRNKESDYENNAKVERYVKAEEGLGKDIGDGIVQRYIRCKGKNRDLEK